MRNAHQGSDFIPAYIEVTIKCDLNISRCPTCGLFLPVSYVSTSTISEPLMDNDPPIDNLRSKLNFDSNSSILSVINFC